MSSELQEKLEASVKRTQRNFRIVLGVLILLELMIAAAIFTDPSRTLTLQVLLGLFGLGLLVLMAKLAQLSFQPHPLVSIVQNEPSRIKAVEVLSIVYQNGRPTYQMNLHFLTTDEQRLVLSDRRNAVEELIPLLKKQLPHAEFKMLSQR